MNDDLAAALRASADAAKKRRDLRERRMSEPTLDLVRVRQALSAISDLSARNLIEQLLHAVERLRDELAARDVDDREQRAAAWDEGWKRCSDWWHECAIGDSHAERNVNPYRAEASS